MKRGYNLFSEVEYESTLPKKMGLYFNPNGTITVERYSVGEWVDLNSCCNCQDCLREGTRKIEVEYDMSNLCTAITSLHACDECLQKEILPCFHEIHRKGEKEVPTVHCTLFVDSVQRYPVTNLTWDI